MTVAARPTSQRTRRTDARVVAILGLLVLLLTLASWVPGVVGTAAAAILPWLGIALAALVIVAALRARRTLLLLVAPALVWMLALLPSAPGLATAGAAEPSSIEIVSQNVRAHSGGAAESASALAGTSADVIALTELDAESLAAARETLAAEYPYAVSVGTVGLWSRFPIDGVDPLTLGLGWKRAMRVVVTTPESPVAIYVLHAASVRPGHQDDRDTMLAAIADAVAADPAEAVAVLGDFNASSADPALAALRGQIDWVRPTDGTLGFTWPAGMPLTRIDHVFARGLEVRSSTTLRAGSSDHLATVTVFAL